MSVPNLKPLQEAINGRISQLEENHEQEKERNQGDGSTAAVWREVEPKIKGDVAEGCLGDLEEVEGLDDFLKILAEWRRKENREWAFNRNNSAIENERNSIKKAEIRGWIDEFVGLIPETEFKACGLCGSTQMPKSDRRRTIGYQWECPDC